MAKKESNRMYPERVENISCFRGCKNGCSYCAFKGTLWRVDCDECKTFTPHAHLNVLDKTPKPTPEGMFSTIALTGDICYAPKEVMDRIVEFCNKWDDRTFMLQSKRPSCFLKYDFPDNVILGTTIETNRVNEFTGGASIMDRVEAMLHIQNRTTVTIEPIMDFDFEPLYYIIKKINPYIVWLGYDSKPEKNNLPEPLHDKVERFITTLRAEGFDVRTKDMRKPVELVGP